VHLVPELADAPSGRRRRPLLSRLTTNQPGCRGCPMVARVGGFGRRMVLILPTHNDAASNLGRFMVLPPVRE
jgi:hypothetical protein